MRTMWVWVVLVSLASCSVSLELPTDARVECGSDAECPQGYVCADTLGYCVSRTTTLPELRVSFTSPNDGATDVSLGGQIIIVFNMEAELPDTDLITLVSEDGSDVVPITITAPAAANTVVVQPRRLYPQLTYVLTVREGVRPAPGVFGAASTASAQVRFTTTLSGDETPPPAVSSVVLEHDGVFADIRWTEPDVPDIAGVAVIALYGTEPLPALPNGRLFISGDEIDRARVIYVGSEERARESTGIPSRRYAVVPFDTSLNYGPAVTTPVASIADTRWCPSHVGSLRVASPDAESVRVSVSSAQNTILSVGSPYPAMPVSAGEDIPFSGKFPFAPGMPVYVRAVATLGVATYVGPDFTLDLPTNNLNVNGTQNQSAGYLSATFQPQSWPAFEAQVRVPETSATTWRTAQVRDSMIDAYVPGPGTYYIRARPVVAGCDPGPFTTSLPLNATVGTEANCYVRSDGGGNACTIASPCNLPLPLTSACSGASALVRIAGGTYTSELTTAKSSIYLGGYDSTFASRDLSATPSIVQTTAPLRFRGDGGVVVDGVRFSGSAGGGENLGTATTDPSTASSGIISHSVITNPGGSDYGLYVHFANVSLLSTTISGAGAVAFAPGKIGDVKLIDSTATGNGTSPAVTCALGLFGAMRSSIAQTGNIASVALAVEKDCTATVERSVISATTVPGATGAASAVRITWGAGRFFNNQLSGGIGTSTAGVRIITDSSAPSDREILFSNNTIHAGLGTTAGATGRARKGFVFLGTTISPQRTIRLTNNLIVGEGGFDALTVQTSFPRIASIQNNVAVGAEAFYVTYATTATDVSLATAQANACAQMPPTIMTENTVLESTPVFANAVGADGRSVTITDNDWRLLATAPRQVRDEGRVLSGANSCGGESCGETDNADCGTLTLDFAGFERGAATSVGAFQR